MSWRKQDMEQPIHASTRLRAAYAASHAVLLEDPAAVFSEHHTIHDEGRERRVSVDLGVDLGAGASVHQDVVVRLGAPRCDDTSLTLPVSWQATGHEHLLPTFAGTLGVSQHQSGTDLLLSGTYAVPLGVVGRFGDGVLGRRLARRSLEALVERIASRMEAAVHSRLDANHGNPGPLPVERREQDHPEIYIG